MSDSQKWAWWALGVVALTIGAYSAFLIFFGHGPATGSVFALLALTAVPASSRRYFRGGRVFDEREQQIANKALRAGFSAVWLVFIGLFLAIGFGKGWDATLILPVWSLEETVWWAAVVVIGVEATTTLILYRGGAHA
jgi:hypothetical protein